MPIRRSPNGVRHTPPQPGRDRSEQVVAINRNAWSQSIGISGRNQSVRAGDKSEVKGPYSSMASVTLMIARQLKREITKRDAVHQLPE